MKQTERVLTCLMPIIAILLLLALFSSLRADLRRLEQESRTLRQQQQRETSKKVNTPLEEEETYISDVSMYNLGDPLQTDDSPCIGASMVNLCQLSKYINVCASNCFDMGTRLEIVGLGECIVLDKMNSRYGCEMIDWAIGKDEKAYSGEYDVIIK